MLVWLNGCVIDDATARIAPHDRGFTLGDGVFETIRIADGRPRHLERHLARLSRGAGVLGITLAAGAAHPAVAQLLSASGLAEGILRLTVSRGEGARGLLPPPSPRPTILATVAPWAPPPARIRLATATVTCRNEHSPLASIKSLNMLDNVLARAEAAALGADEALLLNTAGRVAEAATANLFALLDGALVTPPVAEGALPGIARAVMMATVTVAERRLTPAELRRASEIVLTNSLGVRAVASLDGHPVGADCSEPLAARLASILG